MTLWIAFGLMCLVAVVFVALPLYRGANRLSPLLAGSVDRQTLQRDDDRVATGFRETGESFTFAAMGSIIARDGYRSMVELGCGR